MPIYEYYCSRCGGRFELLRPLSRRDEPATCPAGHPGAERVLSLFAAFSSGDGGPTALGRGGCAACAGGHCASCSHG
jgi:putative FmdB family regulatory protein